MMDSSSAIRIAVVGNHSPSVKAHVAIPIALQLSAQSLRRTVRETWFGTEKIEDNAAPLLEDFDAVWCAPGSPYESMQGALDAIRFARESGTPFLGTCGGCQHAIIEFFRNVLGLEEADHAESNPSTNFPLISPLPCALRETESAVRLVPGTRIHAIYGKSEILEPFNCGYGLNPDHNSLLNKTGMVISGFGEAGTARVVELENHPFFVATLFQPERSAFNKVSHPLVTAFLKTASCN